MINHPRTIRLRLGDVYSKNLPQHPGESDSGLIKIKKLDSNKQEEGLGKPLRPSIAYLQHRHASGIEDFW